MPAWMPDVSSAYQQRFVHVKRPWRWPWSVETALSGLRTAKNRRVSRALAKKGARPLRHRASGDILASGGDTLASDGDTLASDGVGPSLYWPGWRAAGTARMGEAGSAAGSPEEPCGARSARGSHQRQQRRAARWLDPGLLPYERQAGPATANVQGLGAAAESRACSTAGSVSCQSATIPRSARSKIGASRSTFTATTVPTRLIPTVWFGAPRMPNAM